MTEVEPSDPRPLYRNLYFGRSDSRNEISDNREDFVRSFVNIHAAVDDLVSGRKFLVLGPKGTGKSALGWFLEASGTRETHVAKVQDASDLPLAEVPRLQTGQAAGPERTVTAWKFILLCNYMELIFSDQSSDLNYNTEAQRVAKLLRDFGFMGDTSGRALVKASATTIQVPIPKLGTIYKRESKPSLNIYNLIPYMEEWVSGAWGDARHILLIDGLDSIFLNDRKYDESLSSLVQAAYSLNQKLRQAKATGSIVLLLRNDVFGRVSLSLPDSQKMRDDLALDLDWRILTGPGGRNAPLIRLVNSKASRAAGVQAVDILSYFPENVEVGQRGRGRKIPSFQYLLNMTRHTPRDLLRLFEEIRKVDDSEVYEDKSVLSDAVIREGVLQYATKYFVGAIGNEFAGYSGGPEGTAAAMRALKAVNKQIFSAAEFEVALSSVAPNLADEASTLLRLLFFAGAIGNYVGGRHSESYMQFYHRRDDSEIYLKGQFVLHHALIHAWNLTRNGPANASSKRTSGRVRRRRRIDPPSA